ncbi:KH domain-containing protein [Priestia megaterium]|nr:KH domain-containing protein [Priestia megaterium]
MTSLIETIVKPLVDYPEEVRVKQVEEEHQVIYFISVHNEDIGKVIGKHGRVAKAIRTVVYAAASQLDKKVYVKIQE